MKYTIKQNDWTTVSYINENGWFFAKTPEDARKFNTREEAESYMEDELCDPKYKKKYMQGVTLEVIEVEE